MVRRAKVVGVLVVTAILATTCVVRWRARSGSERDYVAMVACLFGPERVTTAAEAEVRMRRLALVRTPEDLARCAALARAVGASWTRRLFRGDLVGSARETLDALDGRTRLPVLELVANARALRWPSHSRGPDLPHFILDASIPELRRAIPSGTGAVSEPSDPSDEIWLYTRTQRYAVVASGARGTWSTLRWEERRPPSPNAFAYDGVVHVTEGDVRRDLTTGDEGLFVGEVLLIRRGAELFVRRADALDDAASPPIAIPERSRLEGSQACRLDHGIAIVLGGTSDIPVFGLEDGRVTPWGSVARPPLIPPDAYGHPVLTCDGSAARIAFGVSHPDSGPPECCAGAPEFVPSPSRRHGIVSARCDAAGCGQRETTVRGIDNGWEGTDPFRPDPRWLAPDVVAFGDRLLVVWNDSNAVRFRVGRLEDLATVESQWLVETFAPEPGSHLSPRSISYPDIVLNGRGGVALLQLHERDPMGATFLLRFEGDAPPSALVPGTP